MRNLSDNRFTYLYSISAIALVAWTLLIAGSLAWNIHIERQQTRELATKEARSHFNKDKAFRLWGASHGGVYVPINDSSPPNPNLAHIPERDITTPSGNKLTLMNPAYMIRQMMNEYSHLYGVKGKITTFPDKLFNPSNAPDDWELAALTAFKGGEEEALEFTALGGHPHLRLMRPLFIDKTCLKCHAAQGYKVGDLRGGVSVSVPLTDYLTNEEKQVNFLKVSYSVVWFLGLGFILAIAWRSKILVTERLLGQEKLRESKEKYQDLYDNAPDMFCSVDAETTKIRRCNQTLATKLGYTKEEIIGKPIFNLYHPDCIEGAIKTFGLFAVTGEVHNAELQLMRKDSSKIDVMLNVSSVRDETGKIIHSRLVWRDITKRKKAENTLLLSQTKLSLHIQNTPLGCISWDRNFICTEWNKSAENIFGYSADEAIGHHPTEIILPSEVKDEVNKVWKLLLRQKGGTQNINENITKDGKALICNWYNTPIVNNDGEVIGVTSLVQDITEQQRVGKELRQQEWRYRSVTDSVLDAIIGMDSHGDVISWNKSAELIFGYTEREVLGKSLTSIIPERFKEAHKSGLRRVLETGKKNIIGKTVELTALKRDGLEFPIELTLGSWQGNQEKFFSGVIRDITERKEMEKALRQSQKMDSLGNLAGGIAHDVNNMLLPIITLSEMTMKDLPEGSREQKRLEKVVEAGNKAKELISGILAFSHRSDLDVKRENTNIVDLIQETLNILRSTLPSTITVTDNLDPHTGLVHCDPSQISSVLLNMASNTVDALEGHVGEFSFSVVQMEVTEHLAQRVPSLDTGQFAKLTITDTGKGIDAETLNHIFDPFFTTKQVSDGTGLGLAMAHGIITKHGGAIDVSSKVGVGTTFDIYLPLAEQE